MRPKQAILSTVEASATVIPNALPMSACAAYERTKPMFNYTVDECGPVQLVVGDGGNIEGAVSKVREGTTARSSGCTPVGPASNLEMR